MLRTEYAGNDARRASVLAAGVGLGLLLIPSAAGAQDLSFRLEPGVALPLNAPQSDVFKTGGGQSLELGIGLTPWLDIGPSASFTMLPARASNAESGVVWGLGGGVRVKRPHDAQTFSGISPWADLDALYIRTGELNRPGFSAAVGLAIPVGETRAFWVGPFVRFLQTAQAERVGFDNRDARILTLGVSLEFGSGVDQEQMREPPPEIRHEPPEVRIVNKDVVSCPDDDQDGVPDSVDRCPDVAGTMENWGCPAYKKVVVGKTKLELTEKIQFEYDNDKIEDVSLPVLDEVAQALKDNKRFKVQIEGHSSSEGSEAHNQNLSARRANAVLEYLVSRGVARDRVVSKGFGSSQPSVPNTTAGGREANRRVEFVVSFIILNDGAK